MAHDDVSLDAQPPPGSAILAAAAPSLSLAVVSCHGTTTSVAGKGGWQEKSSYLHDEWPPGVVEAAALKKQWLQSSLSVLKLVAVSLQSFNGLWRNIRVVSCRQAW